jgi:hypothetical protein
MSKRIDFAKERRAQGRLLSSAVRELAALIQPVAHQHGIDLQACLDEASARKSAEQRLLAERLQESVVPLFIGDRGGQPDRIGSCVLVRLDSDFFAFTAAHVIRDADSATLFAPSEGRGGKLLPLPPCTAHLNTLGRDNDLDVGVLVLPARQLGPFQQRVFLAGTEIGQDDRPDEQGLESKLDCQITHWSENKAMLTPSNPRLLLRHHRHLLCRRRHLPLRLLPRLALVGGKHRQVPTDQKGLSRGSLDVFCSCPMVRLVLP